MCAVACPTGAAQVYHFRDEQIGDMIDAAFAHRGISDLGEIVLGAEGAAQPFESSLPGAEQVGKDTERTWDYEEVEDMIEIALHDQKVRHMIDQALTDQHVKDMIDGVLHDDKVRVVIDAALRDEKVKEVMEVVVKDERIRAMVDKAVHGPEFLHH